MAVFRPDHVACDHREIVKRVIEPTKRNVNSFISEGAQTGFIADSGSHGADVMTGLSYNVGAQIFHALYQQLGLE